MNKYERTVRDFWRDKDAGSDHHRTYDKKAIEKLFSAAVWCFAVAFCALCWFFVTEYFL